jgi:hypothetical protein
MYIIPGQQIASTLFSQMLDSGVISIFTVGAYAATPYLCLASTDGGMMPRATFSPVCSCNQHSSYAQLHILC